MGLTLCTGTRGEAQSTNSGGWMRLTRNQGGWFYPYRAIGSAGATIDFFLSAFRSAAAAKALFAKALADPSHPQPRVINTDKAKCYPSAIDESKGEGVLRKRCRHRPVQYLNNILEQDHRAIQEANPCQAAFSSVRLCTKDDSGLRSDP